MHQISYDQFCILGALRNSQLSSRVQNGMTTYYKNTDIPYKLESDFGQFDDEFDND